MQKLKQRLALQASRPVYHQANTTEAFVLICRNCNSAWQPDQDQFKQVNSGFIPLEKQEKNIIFLPFWRIRAHVSGIDLDSYAALVKAAKLPIKIQSKWHAIPFHFWGLGFKIRIKMLPQASQMTVCQPQQSLVNGIPENAELHPVTLPLSESVEVLKIIMANIVGRLSTSYRKLNEITIEPKSHRLVYVPFVKTSLELTHLSLNISFLKSQL